MQVVNVILEILKFTVPALVVFFTVQTLLKQYLTAQYNEQALQLKKANQKDILPMRLQAYERLSLFCERISIPALLQRLQTKDMNAATLNFSLLMAAQSEYEHNITQQIYVSDNLWKIINGAKEDVFEMISMAFNKTGSDAPATDLAHLLLAMHQERGHSPLDAALQAIKKEAALNFQ